MGAIVEILMANNTDEVGEGLKGLKVCSLEYLSEEHDACIDMADNVYEKLLDEMKKLQDCGTRIMVKNVVTSCMSVIDGVKDEMDMFLLIDNCSKAVAARWMDRRGWEDG